jgi:hypothetical protein
LGTHHPGGGFITMITEEKVKQIRKQLSKGEPEGEIKNQLRYDGYTEDEIGTLFINLYEKKSGSNESKRTYTNNGQIYNLIGACFLIAGISMLAINTWLTAYAIPLIVLGAISLCAKYFISGKNDQK